jgi:hypothetical protein
MATKLEQLVVRESTETVDDRNILVALTEDQRISFRLKGMKSGSVSIPIKELYEQLVGDEPAPKTKPHKAVSITNTKKADDKEPMISLYRLRSMNAVTPAKLELKCRMDELIVELIGETKTT